MRLTHKTILAVTATLGGLLVALYGAASTVLMDGFLDVERITSTTNVQRAGDAIANEAESLSVKLSDWASWDDAYKYIEDLNPEFDKANLTRHSMENLGLAAILFVDASGDTRYGASVPKDSGALGPLPPDLARLVADHDAFLTHDSLDSAKAGVLLTSDGPLIAASRPIVTSEGTGPARGTMVFARRLDDAAVARLAERLHMMLHVTPQPGPAQGDAPILIQPVDDHIVRGTTTIADVHGKAALRIQVDIPRYIYRQGRASVRYFLGGLAVAGAVFLAITLLLLSRLVLARLGRLSAEVAIIGSRNDLSRRVAVEGTDEIAALGSTINRLLETALRSETSLRSSEEQLRRYTDDLVQTRDKLEDQTRALAGARDQAESANHAKTFFLANMSHEIRTPMTAIVGYADLLLDPAITPSERLDHIQTIRRNGDHLLAIINDILDLSKIEEGRMTIESIPCSPIQIVEEVYSLMQVRAVDRDVSLAVEPQYPLPESVLSDPLRLRQVLVNLVGNAIKFTESGGAVRIRTRYAPGETPTLHFEVADTGIGMTPEQVSALFRPFTQGDSTTTRRFGGTGLGLTISRRLVNMLGGDISVSSQPARGSTFTASFYAPAAEGSALIERSAGPRPLTSPQTAPVQLHARILLAEDGPDNQRLISFYLRKAGAEVEIVENGRLAVERLLAPDADFDLAVMDMQMPELDGYGAASILRQRGCTTPIIALTAHAMAGDRDKCLTAGCDDYLTKPVDRQRLLWICAHWSAADRSSGPTRGQARKAA